MLDDDPTLSLALQWLARPAQWPQAAAALYAPAVRWQAPARGLLIEGRAAVLVQLRADAALFSGTEPVVLRRVVAGQRLIDESVLALACPAGGITGLASPPGCALELKRTRLLHFAGGLIVDEMNLETWTELP